VRERQLALTVPTVTHAARTNDCVIRIRSEAKDMSTSTLRHYRVRLRRSRRLPYRIARLLLLALPGLLIAYLLAQR
jgi:hypothetical protein